jgi:ElaB/YqjD/DUF883 family membrane-anchored ribosome-binding protein
MQSRLGNLWASGKEKASEAEHAVEGHIQRRPFLSVVVALGIGMMIGALSTLACERK